MVYICQDNDKTLKYGTCRNYECNEKGNYDDKLVKNLDASGMIETVLALLKREEKFHKHGKPKRKRKNRGIIHLSGI